MSGMVSYNNLTVAPVANLGVQTLVGDGVLHSSATFSRLTGNASYFDATPTMQFAAANVPRWDHDPLTGAVLGLLIEQQSTNLIKQSSNFSQWIAQGNSTLNTPAGVTGPPGTQAYEYVVGTNKQRQARQIAPTSPATTLTFQAFAKAGTATRLELHTYDNVADRLATFDLSATSVHSQTALVGAGITSLPNGWLHASITVTIQATNVYFEFGLPDVTWAADYAGNGTDSILFGGGQLETGAVATSYIPTSGSAISRAEDVLTYPAPAASGTILLDHDAAAAASLINTNSTDVLVSQGAGKIAIAWDASGTSVCYNGGAVTTGAAITWGSDYRLLKNANAHIKPNGALKYPRKLSDAELQAATA